MGGRGVLPRAYPLILAMTLPLALPLTQNTGIEIQRAKNRHRARSIAMLLGAVGNVAITIAFAPALGCRAPAMGYILSITLCNGIFMNWYYHYRIGLDMGLLAGGGCLLVWGGYRSDRGVHGGVVACSARRWMAAVFVWGALYTVLFGVAVYAVALDGNERAQLRKRIPFLAREA